ncbi:hypothetical protein Sjap_007748 [Stephania japonica]|uniref:Cytochrome P450 n=1 Tax=Stephania japonica TaxID=461633 RepID=A0AAP0PBM0_9MAGN
MIASLNTSTTENVEKASDDEMSGSNEEMSGSALPASAGMMSSEALPVEGTLENKEDEDEDEVERRRQQETGKDKVKNIFLAGVDSSATPMVWAMTELARKPELMKKAQEEIRRNVEKKDEASDHQDCNAQDR